MNTNADCPQLLGMVDQIRINLGRKPHTCSADAGYCSEANLAGLAARRIRAYVATGRQKHGDKAATHAKNGKPGSLVAAMRDRLKRGGWRSPYRLRKQVVAPVSGQIKQAMGLRQFLLRGRAKAKSEWQLVRLAHTLTLRNLGQAPSMGKPPPGMRGLSLRHLFSPYVTSTKKTIREPFGRTSTEMPERALLCSLYM